MTKRTNGEGTITRRKNGTYMGAVYVLATGGHQKRIYLYGKTVKAVQERLIAAKAQSLQGVPVANQSWTLAEFADYWLKYVADGNRRISTKLSYIRAIELFLKPDLGSYRLERLTAPVVQKWVDRVYRENESAHQVRWLKSVLGTILTRAEREELVQKNVAHLIELPRYRAKKRKPWSIQEARYFLQEVAEDENYPLYLLLVMYGLRRGEAIGLRWGDLDFDRGVIHIENSLQRLAGQFVQGPTKSDAGTRDIPMLDSVRQVLLNLRATPIAVERDVSDEALVFVTELGTPRDPDGFGKGFKRAVKRHGLREIRMHDLRHTAATMLKDLGVPIKDAQIILGHADIQTTLAIYTHSDLEASGAALTKVEAALLPAKVDSLQGGSVGGASYCGAVVVSQDKNDNNIALLEGFLTSVNNWRARQDSNLRPLVPEQEFYSLSSRVAGVRRAARVCGMQWILGAVVVRLM